MPRTKRTATGVLGGLLGVVGLSAVAGLLITATVTPALAVAGTATTRAIDMFDSLPANLEIDQLMEPSIFYAKNPDNGEYVEMTRFYEQNRSPVRFDQIAPVMIDALLASEDNRYFTHGGIDLLGTMRAFVSNSQSGSNSGGSSISQQYVKNVQVQKCEADATNDDERNKCYTEATNSKGTKGYERKLQEMRFAMSVDKKYDKETILAGYLNIANFGGVTYGIDAAARRYFGVGAGQLNLAQAATLAGMVQNPNQYRIDQDAATNTANNAENGFAATKERQKTVLWNMQNQGKITKAEYETAVEAPITPNVTSPKKGCAAAEGSEYFCQMVKEMLLVDDKLAPTYDERVLKLERGGLRVYTTMDSRLQANATNAVHDLVQPSQPDIAQGSSGVNIEVKTGRILSVAQNTIFTEGKAPEGADPNAYSSQVFASDKLRGDNSIGFSAGSTFKIFTLLEWLEEGNSVNERLNGVNRLYKSKCNGETIVQNEKINNFGNSKGFAGSIRDFTGASLNSGFLAMAERLDMCSGIADMAKRFGAIPGDGTPLDTAGFFWILGSNNISPIAMGGAYAAVANGGKLCTPHAIDRITDSKGKDVAYTQPECKSVVTPEVAATALYALRAVMEGGTGAGGNPYDGTQLGGKTGTHESKQTWLIETSSAVTSVAWVGQYNSDSAIEYFTNQYGTALNNVRYELGARLQGAADSVYPAADFPAPDQNLLRPVYKDLPSVLGKPMAEAQQTLEDAGFQVAVGPEVSATQPPGTVGAQDPGAGQAAGGSVVTISPSNGKGGSVPNVAGKSLDDAEKDLRAAGFNNLAGSCTAKNGAGNGKRVTGTNPAAGSAASKDQQIIISYENNKC